MEIKDQEVLGVVGGLYISSLGPCVFEDQCLFLPTSLTEIDTSVAP